MNQSPTFLSAFKLYFYLPQGEKAREVIIMCKPYAVETLFRVISTSECIFTKLSKIRFKEIYEIVTYIFFYVVYQLLGGKSIFFSYSALRFRFSYCD
jgi:hypothetical protein